MLRDSTSSRALITKPRVSSPSDAIRIISQRRGGAADKNEMKEPIVSRILPFSHRLRTRGHLAAQESGLHRTVTLRRPHFRAF